MTGEVLKVSYIRQIKADRLGALAVLLFVTSILFIFLVAAQSLAPRINDPQRVRVEGIVEVHDKSKDQTAAPLMQDKRGTPPKGHRGPTAKP